MPETDRLEDLNARFIAMYEAARSRLVDAQKRAALLVVEGEEMLFFHGSREPEVIGGLRPPLYTKLKILGHVPLAIFSRLTLEAGAASLSDVTAADLAAYRERLRDCAADLDTRSEAECGTLPHPMTVCERSLAFLDVAIALRRVSEDGLQEFAANMAEEVNVLFAAAARTQLDVLHGHILRIKQTVLSRDEWRDFRVVVMGPHMAHKEDLFLQYFSRVLHTPMYADRRLVYYEGDDPDAALDLLGTTLIDARVSHAFFKDQARLHRDVLADAAKDYLTELLAEHEFQHKAE